MQMTSHVFGENVACAVSVQSCQQIPETMGIILDYQEHCHCLPSFPWKLVKTCQHSQSWTTVYDQITDTALTLLLCIICFAAPLTHSLSYYWACISAPFHYDNEMHLHDFH